MSKPLFPADTRAQVRAALAQYKLAKRRSSLLTDGGKGLRTTEANHKQLWRKR